MSAPAPTTALSAPPPDDALPPTTNHLPLLHSDESEKPSHASSLAGQKDGTDFDATATTTAKASSKLGLFSRRWALGPVVKDYGDYGLLACSFVTGMVDGASFLNWGVFVGMQTGNTVILGLSTAGLPSMPYAWLATLVSLITFLLGAMSTFHISKYLTPRGVTSNRLWTVSLFAIQGIFIFVAAALATPNDLIAKNPAGTSFSTPEPEYVKHDIRIVSLLPLLGWQAGMQIAASRLLGYNELPVNVVTSTYCDLMGDFKLLATNNVKRNRRAASVLLLFIGSVVSAWLMRSWGGLESVLWVAGGIKVLAAVGLFVWVPALEEKILPS